jgi:DNA-binding transcriptional LysR family regulator
MVPTDAGLRMIEPSASILRAAEVLFSDARALEARTSGGEALEGRGLARNITARCPHFGLLPRMVASSLLILTTGRQLCERYLGHLPVQILPCPVPFPELVYCQPWHERSHAMESRP